MSSPKRGKPTPKADAAKQSTPTRDDPQRREQALSLKLSGATDYQISRQLNYPSAAEVESDLRRSYDLLSLLEPEQAKKLSIARINLEILRLEQAKASLLSENPSRRDALRATVEVARAKAPLFALLNKVEGTNAPTVHTGEIRFRPVAELTDAELERIARANGISLLPPGRGGAAPPREGEGGEG